MTPPSRSFPLAAAFFTPLLEFSTPAHLECTCHRIEGSGWIFIGASRNLGKDASGRAFLDAHQCPIARLMIHTMDDPFAGFGELDSYELFDSDCHWHADAYDPRDAKGNQDATGHGQLRSHPRDCRPPQYRRGNAA